MLMATDVRAPKSYQSGPWMSGRDRARHPIGVKDSRDRLHGRVLALLLCAALVLSAPPANAGETASVRVAVLGVELVAGDLSGGAEPTPEENRRRALTAELLRELLAADGYVVVDQMVTDEVIAQAQVGQFLHMCNGCELDLGRALDADWIVVAWVQRVSNLILNFNVVVRQVSDGGPIARSFVDLRGNNDKAWLRAARYAYENALRQQLDGRT